ncbi:PRP38 family protein [Nitzschia inconspicua]|uniref:Pre-mRNA-splicing factor 38 n=1 Tax=Nitzschia inconspicua TaxID=303405 RepID=A0A9K3LYX3_9STRA|nr:PRP38 family protein [Nitzschia inconspicua]
MSRSALWRQEGVKKERERQAEELFELAVEEGRNNRARNVMPLWGPDDSFHLNSMLLQNLIRSSYFQKCCRDLTDWSALVDEVYYQVQHVEPFSAASGNNRDPSAAFCLLLRLMTLRCTTHQMKMLLDHPDSPYIRAIGFLYLRFVGDPKDVYQWIEPYLYDEEPIAVTVNAQKKQKGSQYQQQQQSHPSYGRGRSSASSHSEPETIGEYVRKLFSEREYYGTMLPRLPVHIERDIQVKLLLAEKIQRRAQKHLADRDTMNEFQRIGAIVMALYGDDENPVTWYEAVVDRVVTRNEETGQALKVPKFIVTFPEYGNTETVLLGEMERRGVPLEPVSTGPVGGGSDRGYDDRDVVGRDGRGRGGGGGRGGGYDLYDEVRKREQEKVTARGRNAVAQRPLTAKASLAAAPLRKGRGYNDDDGGYRRHDRRLEGPSTDKTATTTSNRTSSSSSPPRAVPPPVEQQKKRSAEEIAMIQEKKRKLMAKYG